MVKTLVILRLKAKDSDRFRDLYWIFKISIIIARITAWFRPWRYKKWANDVYLSRDQETRNILMSVVWRNRTIQQFTEIDEGETERSFQRFKETFEKQGDSVEMEILEL